MNYAILSENFATVFRCDQAETIPEYSPEVMARIVDLTGLEPLPQANWMVHDLVRDDSGRITSASFTPLPGPTIEDLKARLRRDKTAYIASHYDQDAKDWLQCLYMADTTAAEDKALIKTAFGWVGAVVAYWRDLEAQLAAGVPWDQLQVGDVIGVNFAQFNNSDPKVSL